MRAAQLFLMTIILGGCVSVHIAPPKAERSTGVKFEAPASPFTKAAADNVDGIWRNTKNGNAISYLSDCSDTSDPPLTSIEQGVLTGLNPYTYVAQKETKFEGRAARRSTVKGQVDGIPSIVDLLIFKRNNCIYILSYAGLEQHHETNKKSFDEFISRFKTP